MKAYEWTRKYRKHRAITLTVIALVGIYVLAVCPFGMEPIEAILFVVVSQLAFRIGLSWHTVFAGYGAAAQVNAVAKESRVTLNLDFGRSAWNGYAVQALVRSWKNAALGCLVIPGAAILFRYGDYVSPETVFLAATYSAARFVALAGELYIWFAVNRRRLWYLPAKFLRRKLLDLNVPGSVYMGILDRVREQDLILW